MKHRKVTLIFTALILAMFARQVEVGLESRETLARVILAPGDDVLLRCGAAFTGMPLAQNAWRLITSMFVHGGILHLTANALALLQLGYLLEALFGGAAVFWSFSIGGIVAGLVPIILPSSEPGLIYVGASGAIFAIAGTLLVGLRRVTRQQSATWSHRLSSRLVGCLAFNLVLGLVISAVATWADLGFVIANTAHVAGLIAGVVIGLLLPLRLRENAVSRRLARLP